jgi:uncharacterized protein (DUF1684 family)
VLLLASAAWLSTACGVAEKESIDDHEASIDEYRQSREQRLRDPNGWLTLIGLHWLSPGENPIGSDDSLAIVLPADASPPLAGAFSLEDGVVRFLAEPGVEVALDGGPLPERPLRDDSSDEMDVIALGRLRMNLIHRGDRIGLRVKDPQSKIRTAFAGLDYFPLDGRFRVTARLERFSEAEPVEVPTVAGTPAEMLIPGRLRFEIDGTSYTLDPLISTVEQTELFLIFRDETSGTETYGAGRYLYVTLEGDEAVIDFNRAYNPPCAFTRYATCPLPPRSNRLAVAIRAGEKAYVGHE